jgi:outer membrane protein OmpA-like peptidoglycan-associated protein
MKGHIARRGFNAAVVLGLACQISAFAQFSAGGNELISNGSFEERVWCPGDYTQSQLKTIVGWSQANAGTPDHFDACSSGGKAGVPDNMFGSQPALDGDAYAGLVLYSQSKPYYREYMQSELSRPLEAEEWLCVEWWVCAADKGRVITDGLGLYFTAEAPKAKGEGMLTATPQVTNPELHLLSDRWSWTRLSDVFQAKGGEQFVTIGNFKSPEELHFMERKDAPPESSNWAYVYLDDVRVRSVSAPSECSCLNRTIEASVTDPPWQAYQRKHVRWEAVLFDFDAYHLSIEAIAALDVLANEMRINRYLVIEVNGHTDFIGSESYNLQLSEKRAESVMLALREKGVDPNRLKLAWHGSRLPTHDNATKVGRQQNRRVEFELLEHAYLPISN